MTNPSGRACCHQAPHLVWPTTHLFLRLPVVVRLPVIRAASVLINLFRELPRPGFWILMCHRVSASNFWPVWDAPRHVLSNILARGARACTALETVPTLRKNQGTTPVTHLQAMPPTNLFLATHVVSVCANLPSTLSRPAIMHSLIQKELANHHLIDPSLSQPPPLFFSFLYQPHRFRSQENSQCIPDDTRFVPTHMQFCKCPYSVRGLFCELP